MVKTVRGQHIARNEGFKSDIVIYPAGALLSLVNVRNQRSQDFPAEIALPNLQSLYDVEECKPIGGLVAG